MLQTQAELFMSFYNLKISSIVVETTDAKTIFFSIPTDLTSEFLFLPGQYLTIKATVNQEEVRRSYSICSLPGQPTIGITVKKLKRGVMSTFLHDNVQVGDEMEVMPPDGKFYVKTRHDVSRDHYFYAAGSGITPIMSMIQTILEEEPRSSCYLLYGSRDDKHIIFKESLDLLVNRYQDQFYVDYVVSQPNEKSAGGISGIFGKKSSDWRGSKGRVDALKCTSFMYEYPGRHAERHYYMCGPGDFIQTIESYLINHGVDKKSIHKEFFSTPTKPLVGAVSGGEATSGSVKVLLRGETIDVVVDKSKTILEALVALKKDPPYSCTSGACSTCIAKVTKGKVTMDTCYALEDDEIEAGYILTCQAHPASEGVEVTYDIN